MPTIIPTSHEQVSDVARALLDAATSPDDVRADTSGPRLAFVVSDELATKAGFGEYDDDPKPLAESVGPKTVAESKARAPRKPNIKDA